MKTTLSYTNQLYNVDKLAGNNQTFEETFNTSNPEDSQGVLAFMNQATGKTIGKTQLKSFDDDFQMILKRDDKFYYSAGNIKRSRIRNLTTRAKASGSELNQWRIYIENYNCNEVLSLQIHIEEASLIARDGLTWTHRDNVILVDPEDLKSLSIDCSPGNNVRVDNNISRILYKKINGLNSEFYSCSIQIPNSGSTGYTTLGSDQEIDNYIDGKPASGTGASAVAATPAATKRVVLLLEAKHIKRDPIYHEIEVNYVYPRGVKLIPTITNGMERVMKSEEVTKVSYPSGSGYDLRAEEFKCMNAYTNLNAYSRLSDGTPNSKDLVYQFESKKFYDTINFLYDTDKTGLSDLYHDMSFGVLIGVAEDKGAAYTDIKEALGA